MNKQLIVDTNFLTLNKMSKELFNFGNIDYYKELNPCAGNSIYNGKYVKIVFKKYLPNSFNQIAFKSVVIDKSLIKNYATLQQNIVAPRN